MSNSKPFVVIIILLISLLAACGSGDAEPGADEATAAAMAHLASELGVAEADIEVISVVAAEFSDSCLGLGGPAESCLQVITPGWQVTLRVQGQEVEVRTDQTGQQARTAA
jgi:hypothetical protein